MLRIAAMNMMLHEIDTPDINYQDTLSTNFTDRKETRAVTPFAVFSLMFVGCPVFIIRLTPYETAIGVPPFQAPLNPPTTTSSIFT